jgi:hypothetical protein
MLNRADAWVKLIDPKLWKSSDELALEMVGLVDWKNRLNELRDAVLNELETMQKILETSIRTR